MGEWHLSKYLLFGKIPNSNNFIVFNLLKNSRVSLNIEEINLLNRIDNLQENNLFFQKFKKYSIIVNYDELEIIKSMIKIKNPFNKINITICPTIACNFNCPYCFEKHKAGKMSEETQDKIIILIEKILNYCNFKNLNLTWYGGEPLLAIDVIDNLSKKIIKLCDEKKVNYTSNIITNGYFLNKKNVDILNKNKVFNYQITLDGLDQKHNLTRHLINGEPTFEIITENLRTIHIPGVIKIRHNIHNDNKEEIPLLKKFLKNIAKQSNNNIEYYPAIVVDNAAELREGQVKILNEEDACQIGILKEIKKSLRTKINFCSAQNLYSIVIDNEGKLYKCWEDIDKPERSFGNIEKWDIKNPFFTADNPDILTRYLNSSGAFIDKECQECKLLPICAGGCPSKRFYSKKFCLPFKNYLDSFTEALIEKYKNKNEQINN